MKPYQDKGLTRIRALLLTTALAAMGAPVLAQGFDIAAQPLASALNAFGRQSGLQVSMAASVARGMSSRPVHGALSAEQALAQMLAGTGIPFRITADGTALIGTAEAGQAADGSVMLDTLTIGATGGTPAPYAGGQVATGGRVGMLGNKEVLDTPFSTVSYTESYVANRQAHSIQEVIAKTDPAVFTSGSTGMINESYSIRGFGSAISDVSVGGLFGVSPYWRISPEAFERVEVLKGPSALLNGMPPGGSVGGTVNLVPKHAPDEPLTNVTLSYASDAQIGTHVDLARRFGAEGQFGLRANGVWRDGDGAVKDQKMGTRLFALGMDWRGERARLSADLYYSRDHVDGLNRGVSLAPGIGVPRAPDTDTLLNPPWTFSTTKDRAAILRGEFDVTDSVTAYAALGFSHSDFDAMAASTYQVFNEAGDFRTNVSHQRSIYSRRTADVGLRGQFTTGEVRHEWTVNATYYDHDNKFGFARNMMAQDWITNIYNPVWGPAVDRGFSHAHLDRTGSQRTQSIGFADTMSFADDRAQVTFGLRRQKVVTTSWNPDGSRAGTPYDAGATTPAIAANWRLTDQVSIYANYIEGLSAGATAPATAENAGEVFAPYKTRQKEIGAKWDMGSLIQTLSLYEIRKPSSYTDPITNVFSFGGEQRNRGAEWSVVGALRPDLRLMGGLGYVEPELTRTAGGVNQGKMATGMPKVQAKLGAEWDLPSVEGLTLIGNATYMSKQYINADNTLSIGGRTVYDLGARYVTTVQDRPLTVKASLTNVTDKAYWATTLFSGLGAPRTFLLSATMAF
ncbi:TonB-dependent siderophore receptor [Paenirhodobacter sp.]|uniref:TonB-dependent siderophore receptor n=1 Tax=Paenirhodobacter sp. TaxID=1965326 RepID=UPI003B3F9A93